MSDKGKRKRKYKVTIRVVCYEIDGPTFANSFGLIVADKLSRMAESRRRELIETMQENAEVEIVSSECNIREVSNES